MRIKDHDPADVREMTSLDDRRRIRSLEAQMADLEAKLAEAKSVLRPALDAKHSSCTHHGAAPQIDDHRNEVTCGDCGAVLDPYEILRRIARREVNFCYRTNSLREEQAKLEREVSALKARRAALKRDLRRSEPGADGA